MDARTRRILTIAFALIVIAAVIWTAGRYLRRAPQMLVETAIGKKEETIDVAALITEVQELSRLETASMRVMHVSTTHQSYGLVPDALAGDKLTFLAVGDVIAGVDLSQLDRNEVALDRNGTLSLVLPPPQILVSRVDNQRSKVLNRDTGVLRRSDAHLESRARAQAEAAIRREALNKGLLQMAEKNAEAKLGEFLLKLGAKRVRFRPRNSLPAL